MKKPSIDRIDNDGNYTLENCRYIELKENKKRRRKLFNRKVYQKIWWKVHKIKKAGYDKTYRQKHLPQIKKIAQKYYLLHRDDLLNKQKAYYQQNCEYIKQYQKNYRLKHKDK